MFARCLQIEPVSSVNHVTIAIRFDAYRCTYVCKYIIPFDHAYKRVSEAFTINAGIPKSKGQKVHYVLLTSV